MEWQQWQQNTCAMLEVVYLKCEDVSDLTVPLEHMLPNTQNFWLSKFICEVAKQNGEHYPPNSLYLLMCAIKRNAKCQYSNAREYVNK